MIHDGSMPTLPIPASLTLGPEQHTFQPRGQRDQCVYFISKLVTHFIDSQVMKDWENLA